MFLAKVYLLLIIFQTSPFSAEHSPTSLICPKIYSPLSSDDYTAGDDTCIYSSTLQLSLLGDHRFPVGEPIGRTSTQTNGMESTDDISGAPLVQRISVNGDELNVCLE